MWGADPIENVGTYSTQVISADGTTSTWTFITPSSQVTIPTSPAETTDNDIIFNPGGGSKMKFSSSNGLSWSGNSNGYIYVPAGAAGSISMTVKSTSDSRWLQLYVNGESQGDTKRLWSKEANPATDKRGPRTFTFTSSDLTSKGGKTYLHLKDNNTEMKIATFTVTLTTGSYLPGYSVTYDENGHGANQTDLTGQTKLPATLPMLSETGWIFGGWFTDEGLTEEAVAGATISKNTTLYAKWTEDDSVVKYSVTYDLNGPTGSAPTQEDVASGVSITLADAPTWAGYKFDGWLCNIDSDVKAAGSSYTMTAAPTTFTAQWHELDCKIYSLTGGIGSAAAEADEGNVVIDASSLVLKSSNAIIKLTPGSGTFKAGDILTISGTVGNTSKNFGVKISASNNKGSGLGLASVAGTSNPMVATATLSADADYLYICRDGGTTQTLLTCEVHRSCAEGTAAGLSYAEASVNKYTTDAAFTNPLTNTNGLVLTGYKSSNEEVATVNFSTGEVTIVGVGNATISVGSAVQTKAGTLYAAGTASYTLTVAAPPTFAVTYDNNGGDGTMTDSNSPYAEGAEVTLLDNTFTAPSGYAWSAWAVTETVSGNPVAVSEGKFTMPGVAVTVTVQWALIADFDVNFFQGYGDPDAQIGETQTISTGEYATAPEDPTREGYRFVGWSTDGTEANIKTIEDYAIIEATTFTAVWKQVYIVTFDGSNEVKVDAGTKVASIASPTQAGKKFAGWYNGENKWNFSANVEGNMSLVSKWTEVDPNHFVYAYNDDFHYDGDVYKAPDGKVDNNDNQSNKAIATPYTLFEGTEGITSVIVKNGIYDSKGNHVNAFLKLNTNSESNLVFTIKDGYEATLKMKMGSWDVNSAQPTLTFKDASDNTYNFEGEMSGNASGNNYAELTYNLTVGTYTLTTATKTLYISNIDLTTTALAAYQVTYKANGGVGEDLVVPDATLIAECSFTYAGKKFIGWNTAADGTGTSYEVGAVVDAILELYAQWVDVYTVSFDLQGHGDAIDPQDIISGEKATKPADPAVIG
ncbi:MAG: InlB B-repeat-containing protein [Paludibacteraceae bacterium]|nr:InlB B-repeat-containing protein [Paludibacteraceae bacterium]